MQFDLNQIGQMFKGGGSSTSELAGFPLEIKSGSTLIIGIFMLIFSLFWNGICLTMVFGMSQVEGGGTMGLMAIPFLAVGLLVFVMALYFLTLRSKTVITETEVQVMKKSLFGTKEWTEPLAAYRGVLQRTERRSSGSSSSGSRSTTTYYLVDLTHDDPKKSIKLWESRSKSGQRGEWENYAKFLNLPAIIRDGNDYIERNAEDLDKSVTELMKEGKVEIDQTALDERPEGITVSRIDDFTAITFDKKTVKGGWIGLVVVGVIVAVLIYIGFWVEDVPVGFGIAGIVLALVVTGGLIWAKIATRQIRVNRNELNFYWMTQWGDWNDASFPVNEIESVILKKESGQAAVLVIESDEKTKKFGFGVDEDILNWLKNQILTIISD